MSIAGVVYGERIMVFSLIESLIILIIKCKVDGFLTTWSISHLVTL